MKMNLNILGHSFIEMMEYRTKDSDSDSDSDYYICKRCDIIVFYVLKREVIFISNEWLPMAYNRFNDNVKLTQTCEEIIIKNIIE